VATRLAGEAADDGTVDETRDYRDGQQEERTQEQQVRTRDSTRVAEVVPAGEQPSEQLDQVPEGNRTSARSCAGDYSECRYSGGRPT
jgi:hypothetical protein